MFDFKKLLLKFQSKEEVLEELKFEKNRYTELLAQELATENGDTDYILLSAIQDVETKIGLLVVRALELEAETDEIEARTKF